MELFQITPQTPIHVYKMSNIPHETGLAFHWLCSVSDLHTFNDVLMFIF